MKESQQTALFVGRFQPFHKGHYRTLLELIKKHAQVVLGIGSSQALPTLQNPFTAREREELIRISLPEKALEKVRFVHIPDINDDNLWVAHVQNLVGPFDVVYTNNPLVYTLFSQANLPVIKHQLIEPDRYQGTLIRDALTEGKGWKTLVPPKAKEALENMHAEERILTLASKRDVTELLETLNIPVTDTERWQRAFTHRSAHYESQPGVPIPPQVLRNNERMEFLGDAVLEFLITEEIYRKYPEAPEGLLTAQRSLLVRTEYLAVLAERLHLSKYISMSIGEEKNGGRQNPTILANVFEAFVGALYLDRGIEETRSFLRQHILEQLPETLQASAMKDFKTRLQEHIQEQNKSLPIYELTHEEGKDHDKTFTYVVKHQGTVLASGTGKSKQAAQQLAAEEACTVLGI